MSRLFGDKLDNREIRLKLTNYEYALGYKPSIGLVDNILDQFWFHDPYNSFISDEVFLNYLVKYLDQAKSNQFNRYDYYKFVFDQIESEPESRKTLQYIGLIFEKQQNDSVLPNEYPLLLQQVNAPLNKFDIPWMNKYHLGKIVKREEKELFAWEHHTLTEFLVAELFIKNRNPLIEFQKHAILKHQGITAFKPSWAGVLRFLIESDKKSEIIVWLVSFLEEYEDNLDDNLSELLAFVSTDQSPEIKDRIFNLVYGTYFQKVIWIPVWARIRLSKYVNKDSYQRLKKNIKKWSNKTETFVRRGNVVSIIEGLLKENSELLNSKEKQYWKEKLLDFANNPNDDGNGVLQRHSLGALSQFKDEKLIPMVAQKCFEETNDSLLKDEFLQFCIDTNPNSKVAIDHFIKGIDDIYARHGLYNVTTQKGIEYLLSQISQNERFLSEFLEKERIFDKEDGDIELLRNIETHINSKVVAQLKKIIFTVMRISNYYHEGQSNFLRSIIQQIYKTDTRYLFEILNDIKNEGDEQKIDRLFWDSRDLLAYLITKENVKEYFEFTKNLPERVKRDSQGVIYSSKRLNGKTGELAYQEAVKLKLVEKLDQAASEKYFEEQDKLRKQKIYKSFLGQLQSKPNKYITSVFEYYLNNKDEIQKQWKPTDKKKFIKLSVEVCLKKINPRDFKVKLANKVEGNSQFTWSSTASYYGDILEVVKELAPEEIIKYQQHIIDFIPYEFDTSATLKFIEKLNEKEIEWVNQVMADHNDDRRYLIPQTYIYLVSEYAKRGCKLSTVKPILQSFITDPNVRDYTQRSALESLAHFIDSTDNTSRKFLKEIFKNSSDQELVDTANSLLVSVYNDEKAIEWRFEKVKQPLKFDRKAVVGQVHSVGPVEHELMDMSSASPLMNLHDERYLPKFLELLDYSFKFTSKKDKARYWEYVNYLWRTVINFVENLRDKGSFIPIMELESWVSSHSRYQHINWFEARIKEIKKSYLNLVHPSDKLIDGVEELNKIGAPAASIAHFLLKAQLVETRLRELVLGISYFLEKANKKLPIHRKLNSKYKTKLNNMTLSQLCDEVNNYNSESVEKLMNKLGQFAHSEGRNRFNHDLFNQTKEIHELSDEAKKYSKHAEESLDLMQEVWRDILKIK